jgi:hypothetical protein
MRNDPAGGAGEGRVSTEMLWWPPTKVVGHYLAPWLAREAGIAAGPHAADDAVHVEVPIADDRDARPLALEPLGRLAATPGRR